MAKLSSLTQEEKDKLNQLFGVDSEVDVQWLTIAEFGGYFGYEGIRAIMRNEIDIDEVEVLIAAQRKVQAKYMVDIALANLAANAAVNSKKSGTFRQFIKVFTDKMKVKQ